MVARVLADVAAGVHHHPLVLRLAADDIAGLVEVLGADALEKHGAFLIDRGPGFGVCPDHAYLGGSARCPGGYTLW